MDRGEPARSGAPRGARDPRPVPQRHADFAHLALDELRAYRADLAAEEGQVSYWRRLIQARIDIVRQGGATRTPDRRALRRMLAPDRVEAGRNALVQIVPAAGLPPLPQLDRLWAQPTGLDEKATAALVEELVQAETALSAYRRRLHERIDAATAELVARYRESPALAVRSLPLTPPRGRRPR